MHRFRVDRRPIRKKKEAFSKVYGALKRIAFWKIIKRYMVSFSHRYNVTRYVKISDALFFGIMALLSACYWQVIDVLLFCDFYQRSVRWSLPSLGASSEHYSKGT